MGFSKLELLKELTHFRRVGGQYKWRYGIDPEAYLDGAHTPSQVRKALEEMRFDVEQEQISIRIAEREEREEAARIQRETVAQMEIDNVKSQIEAALNSVMRARAREDCQASMNTIFSIIDESVDRYGAETAVEWLRPWAQGNENKLERLAVAIYDDYYNTNDYWYYVDADGNLGRTRYIGDMESFAASMGVTAPPMVYVS